MRIATFGRERYVGRTGRIIGMTAFGASGRSRSSKRFEFEPDEVVAAAKELLAA